MKIAKYYLVVFVFALGLGCTRDADIVIPAQHPALVIHGYVAVGDSFHISLAKTLAMDISLDQQGIVDNGWIVLFENNVFADSLKFDSVSRSYVSGLVAKGDKTYKIIAGAPGFENVESSSAAPLPAPTTSVQRIVSARSSSAGNSMDDIKFSFADPSTQDNYYIAALYTAGFSPCCAYTYDPVIEKYKASLLPFDQGSCISSDQILFNDKTFNGAVREIVVSADKTEIQTYTNPTTGTTYKPYLKLFNVSKEHYTYFKNAIAADANTLPTFSNPVTVKGNIKNGYGLFSVYQLSTDSIP
jgi:hypothetical protein